MMGQLREELTYSTIMALDIIMQIPGTYKPLNYLILLII